MNWDAFLDTFVRLDDGTKIVIISHMKCARASALLFTACALRRVVPEVVSFLFDSDDTQTQVAKALEWARLSRQTRRVVAIVVEPQGPSFTSVLDKCQPNTRPVAVFRINANKEQVVPS
jgi:hypothetical protein